MDYCFHSYPRELARQIAAQWDSAGIVDQLPPEDALTSLLSEAYQASLLREEDRAVVCRLMLVNPAELADDAGPPSGLHVLRFVEERPMHEQEIRRLSPTATFYRSLIGLRWDSKQGFLIWGIVNSGLRWINETDGGRLRGPVVPNCLIIHIRGPGTLVALRGPNRIATLLNGKLQDTASIFSRRAGWLICKRDLGDGCSTSVSKVNLIREQPW